MQYRMHFPLAHLTRSGLFLILEAVKKHTSLFVSRDAILLICDQASFFLGLNQGGREGRIENHDTTDMP